MSILNKLHDLVAAAGHDISHLVAPQQQQKPIIDYAPIPALPKMQPMHPAIQQAMVAIGAHPQHPQYTGTPGTVRPMPQEDGQYVAAPGGIMPLSSVQPGQPWHNLMGGGSDQQIVGQINNATGYPRGVDPALFGYPADNTVTHNLPLYLKRR